VRDCQVIDICNMSRRFVLSPAALRYWFPPISALGQLMERFCCELQFKRHRVETSTDTLRPLSADRSFFLASAAPILDAAALAPELSIAASMLGIQLADLGHAAVFAGNVGLLSISKVPAATMVPRAMRQVMDGRAERQRTARDLGGLRDELRREIRSTLAAEREATIGAARDAAGRLIEERVATIQPVDVRPDVRNEIEAALSEEAFEKRMQAAKILRDLRSELRRLSEAVKKLQQS
jgi:hypothetical protein